MRLAYPYSRFQLRLHLELFLFLFLFCEFFLALFKAVIRSCQGVLSGKYQLFCRYLNSETYFNRYSRQYRAHTLQGLL